MNVLFQKLLWCSTGSSLLLQIHFLNSNGRLTVKSVKATVNYGTCWDAVGSVSYRLCRVISLLLFTWPDFSLPHLQIHSFTCAAFKTGFFLRSSPHRFFHTVVTLGSRFVWNVDFFALFFSCGISLSPLHFFVFQLLNLFGCCIFLNKIPWTAFECPCSHFSFVPLELVR